MKSQFKQKTEKNFEVGGYFLADDGGHIPQNSYTLIYI